MKILTVRPFPICCGAEVIGYFGWSKTNAGAEGPRSIVDIEADLSELDKARHVGARFLTLAKEQRPHVEPSLKKFGYELLMEDFYHPGHNSYISLYGKPTHKSGETKIGGLPYGKTERAPDKSVGAPATNRTVWGTARPASNKTRPVW